jgi:NAD(P)-dependent dehydrogenase (short-subunit alcohol dehydrogenase family)
MKIVVIGGTGLIGSRLVQKLRESGHEALAAAPSTGVDTVTGEGLSEALQGAQVLVDVSNAPNWEDDAVMRFFQTSSRNPRAGFFGITPSERTLLPEDGARLGETRFGDWLRDAAVSAPRDDSQSVMDASHA